MKKRGVVLLAVVALLGIAAAPGRSTAGVVAGELHWTHNSVCEYPIGVFLQDYVGGACGEVFLSGDLFPSNGQYEGNQVVAGGVFVQAGNCLVLVANRVDLCEPPDPPDPDGE